MSVRGLRARVVVSRAAAVGAAIAFALFGSFLLVLTPELSAHPGLQILWVLFSLVLLKVPLLALVWWLIARRRRTRPRRWSERETLGFLGTLSDEAARLTGLPDSAERLDALRADAWRAVEQGDPSATPAAVALALRLDRRSGRDRQPAR